MDKRLLASNKWPPFGEAGGQVGSYFEPVLPECFRVILGVALRS